MSNAHDLHPIRIVVGTAFQVDAPVEGNVRNYRGAGNSHWLGDTTTDALYFCSQDCFDEGLFAYKFVTQFGTAWVNHYGVTVDIEPVDGDLPDYDVHCTSCKRIVHSSLAHAAEYATVASLIEHLQQFDPDASVWHQSTGGVIERVLLSVIDIASDGDAEHIGAGSVVLS